MGSALSLLAALFIRSLSAALQDIMRGPRAARLSPLGHLLGASFILPSLKAPRPEPDRKRLRDLSHEPNAAREFVLMQKWVADFHFCRRLFFRRVYSG